MITDISIDSFTYDLPDCKIAKYPLPQRDSSKLLLLKDGKISQDIFRNLSHHIASGSLMVFNNTKVIRARIMFFKETGAKIEIFCLEPHLPADYERAFSVTDKCQWLCLVGGRKKWKSGALTITFTHKGAENKLHAEIIENRDKESVVEFSWDNPLLTFGEILHILGKIPIPPYLCRESTENDNETYQTVYSKIEGSVAAPTAGLHFTDEVLSDLSAHDVQRCELTLHVGAGTFLPVKTHKIADHNMHIEHFEVQLSVLEKIAAKASEIIAVGTTSVRTLESLSVLGYRILKGGMVEMEKSIGQWEAYDIPKELTGKELLNALTEYMKEHKIECLHCSTGIMITPSYHFKVVGRLITNFHQPQSTLLMLINAAVGDVWRDIYQYALNNDFRFLSYGDSSLLDLRK
ncbi:MAG: S-adenosylmethionine:tRNA ribosyltransferase-isomerase [Rikenellaceae bacterium]